MNLSIYVGPTAVTEVSRAMTKSGLRVICEGTERVWIDSIYPGDAYDQYLAVYGALSISQGETFGITWRDVSF